QEVCLVLYSLSCISSPKRGQKTRIKGHRASSYNHTELPPFQIKRKGHPISQCEKCRELRRGRLDWWIYDHGRRSISRVLLWRLRTIGFFFENQKL
ncbi:hypothetical protein BDM02DRAFT_3123256, partial [Thelephora ganbajun]